MSTIDASDINNTELEFRTKMWNFGILEFQNACIWYLQPYDIDLGLILCNPTLMLDLLKGTGSPDYVYSICLKIV